MTESKTCVTCHWWYWKVSDDDHGWGWCAYHSGATESTKMIDAKGVILTRSDFGCITYKETDKA